MADREPKLVESPKDPRERSGDVFVNDDLADVNALVEAPVLYDQDPQLSQLSGAAGTPDAAIYQGGTLVRRQRVARRMKRGDHERQNEKAQHRRAETYP